MDEDEAGDSEWPDSGPFCQHWGDPSDCDEPCGRCGHTCTQHGGAHDGLCNVPDCQCDGFIDANKSAGIDAKG